MKLRQLVAASVCLCLANGAFVNAQQQSNQPRPNQPGQPNQQNQVLSGQHVQGHSPDQVLATCVAIANQEEIAIAKFAQEKAKNPEVREFAQMLVKDHQQFLQKLQPWAAEATRDGYLMDRDTRSPGGDQRSSSIRQGTIQQTAAKPELGQPLNFVALHRELAENCIQQTKMEMSKKDADKFDECFIGFQIAAHAGMKNKLMVFERHASADLEQVLAPGLQTTEQHLKRAEEIMKKLSESRSESKR